MVRLLQAAANVSGLTTLVKLDWHTFNEVTRPAVERGLERRSVESGRFVGLVEEGFQHFNRGYLATIRVSK